jgi:tetratricopeptide (TPR) repeat protein
MTYRTCIIRLLVVVALVVTASCSSLWRERLAAIVGGEMVRKNPPRAQAFSHFLAATVYERKGQAEQAVEEMRHAVDLDPESTSLTIRLIRSYVRNQNFENARLVAERAVAHSPKDANLWVILGGIYHQLNQDEKAVESFQKAIAVDPQNVLGYGMLVSVEESANDYVAAIDIYQRLAELTPNAAAVHYNLGVSLVRINDTQGARAALERALELKPDLARARYMLGILLMEAGENEAAVEPLRQYLAQAPNDLRARETLAGALARLKNYPEAIELVTRSATDKKEEPRYSIEAMYLLLRAGRFAEVETMLPSSGAPVFGTVLRAFARKGMGEPYAPLLASLDAMEADLAEECTAFLNELVFLFGKQDTCEFFIENLKAARREGVESRTVEILLARTLMALERREEVEAILAAALDRFGPDATLHYFLAIVNEDLKRIPEAEQHLTAYLKLKPDDPEVLNFLGYLYADHNMKLDEAEALLKRALEIQPGNGFYLDSLGWVYYRKGDADRAIEFIRKAIPAMDNDDAELRNHLGDAYLLKGDVKKAIAEWRHAHRLDPKLEGVQEKMDKYAPPSKGN